MWCNSLNSPRHVYDLTPVGNYRRTQVPPIMDEGQLRDICGFWIECPLGTFYCHFPQRDFYCLMVQLYCTLHLNQKYGNFLSDTYFIPWFEHNGLHPRKKVRTVNVGMRSDAGFEAKYYFTEFLSSFTECKETQFLDSSLKLLDWIEIGEWRWDGIKRAF